MRILLIIPAFNEQASIIRTVDMIRAASFPAGLQVDYLVIDDGSTDMTAQLCREHGVPCVSLVRNLGIGGAVQTGYLYAMEHGYDAAVQFDGDGQHDIASLPALLQPIADETQDFVVGSRFVTPGAGYRSTPLRRIGIRLLSLLTLCVTGRRIWDVTSGYRAANRRTLCYLAENYPADYPEPESLVHLLRHGARVAEVPVNMFARSGGSSSIGSLRSGYYMLKVSLAILCAGLQRKEGQL